MPTSIDKQKISPAGLRTFFRIMDAWGIDDEKSINIINSTVKEYYGWKDNPDSARVSDAQLQRLSLVFGIYKSLQILLPDRQIADAWLKLKNSSTTFNGGSPLDLMSSGRIEDLVKIRQYLDHEIS